MIAIPLASLAAGALIGWCAKVFADAGIVCDTAGNEADSEADAVQSSGLPELLPNPHTDLIVNTLTPLGFLAVQLRLRGDYANNRGILDDAGHALDAVVESLKKDLTPCADCGQINGNHRVMCAGWGDMLKMDWVAKEPKGDAEDVER